MTLDNNERLKDKVAIVTGGAYGIGKAIVFDYVKEGAKVMACDMDEIHTKEMRLGEDVNLSQLASELEGYVGADIEAMCREAVMIALREDLKIDKITLRHFREARKVIHPSSNERITKEFAELERKLLGKSEIGRKDVLGLKDYL